MEYSPINDGYNHNALTVAFNAFLDFAGREGVARLKKAMQEGTLDGSNLWRNEVNSCGCLISYLGDFRSGGTRKEKFLSKNFLYPIRRAALIANGDPAKEEPVMIELEHFVWAINPGHTYKNTGRLAFLYSLLLEWEQNHE